MPVKKLIRYENNYACIGFADTGGWGQHLFFDDGSSEFDLGHKQSDEIARVTRATLAAKGEPNSNALFVPGLIGKNTEGKWVAAQPIVKLTRLQPRRSAARKLKTKSIQLRPMRKRRVSLQKPLYGPSLEMEKHK